MMMNEAADSQTLLIILGMINKNQITLFHFMYFIDTGCRCPGITQQALHPEILKAMINDTGEGNFIEQILLKPTLKCFSTP